jgi:putative membrane protein
MHASAPDPGVLLPLGAALVLYASGYRRLAAKAGRLVQPLAAACFVAGWAVLAVALASPLHALGAELLAAHMVQHELVIVAAAPLLVLGRPVVPWLFALPARWRRGLGRWSRRGAVRSVWDAASRPLVAFALHATAILAWHVPVAYQATLRSDAAHALQHASFLATALVFWQALFHPRSRARHGPAVLYLFATSLYTGGLGALLALSPTPWYPAYGAAGAAWGYTPMEDQQLAGLIMWMPGTAMYLAAALALTAAWLRESSSRVTVRAPLAPVRR